MHVSIASQSFALANDRKFESLDVPIAHFLNVQKLSIECIEITIWDLGIY